MNKILEAKADNKEVFYLDIGAKFLRADGSVDPALVPDLSHPSQQGYEVFGQAVAPVVRKLLQ